MQRWSDILAFLLLVIALCFVFFSLTGRGQTNAASSDYLAVSVPVTTAPANLKGLIETTLGMTSPSLMANWREVTIQVDPETSAGAQVRIGSSNVGTTVGGQVQKGATLLGGDSMTIRGQTAQVLLSSFWVRTVSGTATLNVQCWSN